MAPSALTMAIPDEKLRELSARQVALVLEIRKRELELQYERERREQEASRSAEEQQRLSTRHAQYQESRIKLRQLELDAQGRLYAAQRQLVIVAMVIIGIVLVTAVVGVVVAGRLDLLRDMVLPIVTGVGGFLAGRKTVPETLTSAQSGMKPDVPAKEEST